MENLKEEFLLKLELLYKRIDKKRDMLVVYNRIDGKIKSYRIIGILPEIMNRCLQCGNYRRAFLYFLMAENIMDEIESNEEKIVKKITKYMSM